MASQQNIPARRIAVNALNQCNPVQRNVTAVLNDLLNKTEQRQRTTDLVLGTLRNRTAIDTAITVFSGRRIKNIPGRLLNILRVATCELIYNPQTPEYSIVNEAVNTAGDIAGKKQTGFVNAVLRQIQRHILKRESPFEVSSSARILPQTPQAGCLFDTDFLPDRNSSPEDYLSVAFSLPQWLVADWIKAFGFQQALDICFGSNRKPGLYIRPNPLKTTMSSLAEIFDKNSIDIKQVPDSSMLKIKSPSSVSLLPGFEEGMFSVQDITASLPVVSLWPQAGWNILDICSAPGTKTIQMAEITGDKAHITATDIDGTRLKLVGEGIARLGVRSITTVVLNKLPQAAQRLGLFDAILVDAPCSNTGVLARRVEARYRLTEQTSEQLSETQIQILEKSAEMIKQSGRICYSTCSITSKENRDVVNRFLSRHRDYVVTNETLTLPSAGEWDCDGGYFAILARGT